MHNADEGTLIESLEGQGDAVACALSFTGRVVVAMPSLRPRFNAVATSQTERAAEPPADARQGTAFVAAWTLGSLASLVGAGASSITYFEAAGPRGIAGTPVAELLAAIAEFAPGYAYACEPSAPLSVAAIGLGNEHGERVVVANLRPEPTEVAVTTARGTNVTSLERYAIRWIEN